MQANREELIRVLESVQPGLAAKEIIEQSDCFAFVGGQVWAYNDETAVRAPSPLGEFEGAVKAAPLLGILQKLPDDEVELGPDGGGGEFLIWGLRGRDKRSGRSSGVRMQAEVCLPVAAVEEPQAWKPLHPDFCEALGTVQQCAGMDESRWVNTCVHLHPERLEACDNFNICRWPVKTGLKRPTLVRRSAIRSVPQSGATEIAVTKGWVHFRSPAGVVTSCRRYLDEYHNYDSFLEGGGEPAKFPKALKEAAERAALFSSENDDTDLLRVRLSPGRVSVRGEGARGWFEEARKAKYTGKELEFLIPPAVLTEVVSKHPRYILTERRLMVEADRYVYAACLTVPQGRPPDGKAAGAKKHRAVAGGD